MARNGRAEQAAQVQGGARGRPAAVYCGSAAMATDRSPCAAPARAGIDRQQHCQPAWLQRGPGRVRLPHTAQLGSPRASSLRCGRAPRFSWSEFDSTKRNSQRSSCSDARTSLTAALRSPIAEACRAKQCRAATLVVRRGVCEALVRPFLPPGLPAGSRQRGRRSRGARTCVFRSSSTSGWELAIALSGHPNAEPPPAPFSRSGAARAAAEQVLGHGSTCERGVGVWIACLRVLQSCERK